jgi:hypothetical protein
VSASLTGAGRSVWVRAAGLLPPGGPLYARGLWAGLCDLRDALGGRIVFPLERRFYSSYDDTWGAPRTQGGYEDTDLKTPSGVPETP